MKKTVFAFAVFLLISAGSDCFAQSAEARTKALQGEWLVASVGDVDLSIPPNSEIVEQVWAFNGNDYLVRTTNLLTGETDVQTGSFKVIADAITFSHQDGVTQTGMYTLQRNTLTVNIEGLLIILNKR